MRQVSNGLWYSAQYWTFQVDSEANKYRLDVAGYRGDASNGLQFAGAGWSKPDLHDRMVLDV